MQAVVASPLRPLARRCRAIAYRSSRCDSGVSGLSRRAMMRRYSSTMATESKVWTWWALRSIFAVLRNSHGGKSVGSNDARRLAGIQAPTILRGAVSPAQPLCDRGPTRRASDSIAPRWPATGIRGSRGPSSVRILILDTGWRGQRWTDGGVGGSGGTAPQKMPESCIPFWYSGPFSDCSAFRRASITSRIDGAKTAALMTTVMIKTILTYPVGNLGRLRIFAAPALPFGRPIGKAERVRVRNPVELHRESSDGPEGVVCRDSQRHARSADCVPMRARFCVNQ